MIEDSNFTKELQSALNEKLEWFNTVELKKLLDQYRLFFTCVKNLYDNLLKKQLIIQDPYRHETRLSDIVIPDTSNFLQAESASIIGSRLSEFQNMLDYMCTYFHFSVDNLGFSKIKKLLELNSVFDWMNLSINSNSQNTRELAVFVNNAIDNSQKVAAGVISNSIEKCADSVREINSILAEVNDFQREVYKGQLRNDLFEHPEFNKERAFSTKENELAEIKKIYLKIYGKKAFNADLINEIILEDQGQNKEQLQSLLLTKLKVENKKIVKKEKKVDLKETLLITVSMLGVLVPIYSAIKSKLMEDFNLLEESENKRRNKLISLFRKIFGIKNKQLAVTISITDRKSQRSLEQKVVAVELINEIERKMKLYTSLSAKGSELKKINDSSESAILDFLNKNISENQKLYLIINSLDNYFKVNIEASLKTQSKGLKMELSTLHDAIVNINKKRADYLFEKDEKEQLEKLGIHND